LSSGRYLINFLLVVFTAFPCTLHDSSYIGPSHYSTISIMFLVKKVAEKVLTSVLEPALIAF